MASTPASIIARRDLPARLKAACPKGIDVYFENVGGAVFEAVFPLLNNFARVPVCGQIATYNATEMPAGELRTSALTRAILTKRLTLRGFIVSDFAARHGDFLRDVSAWLREGRIKYREDVVDGLEKAPRALIGLLRGENFGKMLVRVATGRGEPFYKAAALQSIIHRAGGPAATPFQRGSPMTIPMILAPLFVLVLMTFVLGFWLAGLRAPLLRRGEVRAAGRRICASRTGRGARMQVGYSFQQPVRAAGAVLCADDPRHHHQARRSCCSWCWPGFSCCSRLAHAYVHVTSNNLDRRGAFFGIGALVLAIMWLIFIVRIMLGLP